MCTLKRRARQRGISLIEQIVFIVVVGAAVAGVLGAINYATRGSVDPIIQKQALAIAEALLEEVQLQPFTYCDPDDPAAATAAGTGDCAAVENPGPEAANVPPGGPIETRTGAVRPFDNVNDYNGLDITGITDITGAAIAGLGAYRMRATVAVPTAAQALGAIATAETLLITVTVDGPSNTTVVLQGYRTRYAPNATP